MSNYERFALTIKLTHSNSHSIGLDEEFANDDGDDLQLHPNHKRASNSNNNNDSK